MGPFHLGYQTVLGNYWFHTREIKGDMDIFKELFFQIPNEDLDKTNLTGLPVFACVQSETKTYLNRISIQICFSFNFLLAKFSQIRHNFGADYVLL